jgi:hypothetical protein
MSTSVPRDEDPPKAEINSDVVVTPDITAELSDSSSESKPTLDNLVQLIGSLASSITTKLSDMNDKIDENKLDTSAQFQHLDSQFGILVGEMELEKQEAADKFSPVNSASRNSSQRKSMFQRELKTATELGERRNVVMNMQSPDFKHIFLNTTDLADYADFLIKWFDFEARYGIKLEPSQIISKKVRNLLMYNHNIDKATFHTLTPEDTCQYLALETKVLSKVQFSTTMRAAVKKSTTLLNWSSVKPSTHQQFFQGILMRKEMFLRIFGIMMEGNKQHCPSLEGKEYGLAKIFLDTIDNAYNIAVLAEIRKVNDSNYDKKIEEFINTYVAQAKVHYDVARTIQLIPYGDSSVSSSVDTKPVYKPAATVSDTHKNYSKPNNFSNNYSKPNFVKPISTVDRTVNHMEDTSIAPDSENLSDHDEDLNDEDNIENCEELMVLEQNFKSNGCINYALYGNCFKASECKHAQGHTEIAAVRTRQWMMEKMKLQAAGSKI